MGLAIEKKLTNAGYRMLGDHESIERLIYDILKTKNIRYLKAIPFLIYKHKADISRIHKISKNNEFNNLLQAIIAITARIFSEFNFKGILPQHIDEEINENAYNLLIHRAGLDYFEFKHEFELQLRDENKPSLFIDKQKIYEERDLQMHLSQFFTKKEKQIIRRLLEEKPISRTDYEYYSRKTKKKLKSIIGLEDFAKSLYAKTPEYDEELYTLKRKLEELITKWKIQGSIIKFHLLDSQVVLTIKEESGEMTTSIWNLNKIKDKSILNLLNRYKEHDFR